MTEIVRNLNEVERARIHSHAITLRVALEGSGLTLGSAPHETDVLDRVWELLVQFPVPEDAAEWLITSFGALVSEQLAVLYSFRWRELEDQYGISPCMVENRSGVRVFPFDTIARKIQQQDRKFFGAYFEQIRHVMQERGIGLDVEKEPERLALMGKPDPVSAPKPWWRFGK